MHVDQAEKAEAHKYCPLQLRIADLDIMSGKQRSGKEVASRTRKRVRTGTPIPPIPAVPRGQTQRYDA
ncbi:hypothetical protein H5410_021521 [Solanum commersonii]|uniref:Uncharacterized protein n=1 Tax=Solanum commersonii TaxID=4109 RepID=A0A9J5ZEH6_SOLCO|nr:hypothetical protein H5410_021521 [Solanum commersonii]